MTERVSFPGGGIVNSPIVVRAIYNGVLISCSGQYTRPTDGLKARGYVELQVNPHEALKIASEIIKAVEQHSKQTASEARAVKRRMGKQAG
jgi:hypothetical protein